MNEEDTDEEISDPPTHHHHQGHRQLLSRCKNPQCQEPSHTPRHPPLPARFHLSPNHKNHEKMNWKKNKNKNKNKT